MVNEKNANRNNKIEPWCFAQPVVRVFVDSSLISSRIKRINSACGIYHLGDTAAVLGVICWHWLRSTWKYCKYSRILLTVVIEWVPVYLYSSISMRPIKYSLFAIYNRAVWRPHGDTYHTKTYLYHEVGHSLRRANISSSTIGIFVDFWEKFC